MATIHFILQGKGGVGKSMIASILYQAIEALENDVYGYDTDPVNATLAGFKEFNVQKLNLLSNDGNINTRKFDELLENLAETTENAHVIVDNGASSFIALGSYIKENDMLEILNELGHTVYFHTVITGGQAIVDTVDGFISLANSFQQSKIVVWLNPYFGTIEMDGKKFTEFKCYQNYEKNIAKIIELPSLTKDTYGKDIELLFAKKHSFAVGINGPNIIAVRNRLKRYWKMILTEIQASGIC